MTHRTVLPAISAFLAMILLAASAHAQPFRAYLASNGVDGPSSPCSLQAPCRLLPAALAAVADGGEIWMLDSANYNVVPVDIVKSVTILAVPGALGSVLAKGGNAINIGTAGVKVALRNLVIVPLPGGGASSGISVTAAAALTVENCLIANLPQFGIFVNTPASVRVTDTTIRDNALSALWIENGARATVTRATISGNGASSIYGSVVMHGTGVGTTLTADIADSTIDGNTRGIFAWSQSTGAVVKVSVRDSRIVGNSDFGVSAQSQYGAAVTLSASNNIISNNNTGIASNLAGAKVWASGNTISGNGYGLYPFSGGIIESAGNNAVRNNLGDVAGAITTIATM